MTTGGYPEGIVGVLMRKCKRGAEKGGTRPQPLGARFKQGLRTVKGKVFRTQEEPAGVPKSAEPKPTTEASTTTPDVPVADFEAAESQEQLNALADKLRDKPAEGSEDAGPQEGEIVTAPSWFIEKGGQGSVQRCLWRYDGQWVKTALKTFDLTTDHQTRLEQYRNERDMFKRVAGCEHLMNMHMTTLDNERTKGRIVLPLAECSLFEYIRRGGYTWREAWALAIDVLRGVEELHDKKVIHRDMKSHNVLIVKGEDGKLCAKISDWGYACCMFDGVDRRGWVGTTSHEAPEVHFHAQYSHTVDNWGAMLVMTELLGGVVGLIHKNIDSVPTEYKSLFDKIQSLAQRAYKGEVSMDEYRCQMDQLLTSVLMPRVPSWMLKGECQCTKLFESTKKFLILGLHPLPDARPEISTLRQTAEMILTAMDTWAETHGLNMDEISVPARDPKAHDYTGAIQSKPLVLRPVKPQPWYKRAVRAHAPELRCDPPSLPSKRHMVKAAELHCSKKAGHGSVTDVSASCGDSVTVANTERCCSKGVVSCAHSSSVVRPKVMPGRAAVGWYIGTRRGDSCVSSVSGSSSSSSQPPACVLPATEQTPCGQPAGGSPYADVPAAKQASCSQPAGSRSRCGLLRHNEVICCSSGSGSCSSGAGRSRSVSGASPSSSGRSYSNQSRGAHTGAKLCGSGTVGGCADQAHVEASGSSALRGAAGDSVPCVHGPSSTPCVKEACSSSSSSSCSSSSCVDSATSSGSCVDMESSSSKGACETALVTSTEGAGKLEGPLLAIRLSSFSVVTSTSGGSDACTSAPQTPPVHPNKLTEAVVLIDLATTETTTALVHKTEGARDGDKKEMLPRWLRYLTACFVGA